VYVYVYVYVCVCVCVCVCVSCLFVCFPQTLDPNELFVDCVARCNCPGNFALSSRPSNATHWLTHPRSDEHELPTDHGNKEWQIQLGSQLSAIALLQILGCVRGLTSWIEANKAQQRKNSTVQAAALKVWLWRSIKIGDR